MDKRTVKDLMLEWGLNESSDQLSYGNTKPHLSHEEMAKLGPTKHNSWAKAHQEFSQSANKIKHESRKSGDKVKQKEAEELVFKHNDAHNMHQMYANSHTAKTPEERAKFLERAKQYHSELTNG